MYAHILFSLYFKVYIMETIPMDVSDFDLTGIDLDFLDGLELMPVDDKPMSKLPPRHDFDTRTEEDVLSELKAELLSEKEKKSEEYLKHFMINFDENEFKASANSADLSHQERLQQAHRKMAESSVILAHKYQPFIKEYVAAQEQQILENKFAIIKATPGKIEDMAERYRKCFTAWVNAKDDVHIKVRDKKDVGNIDIVDAFTLVFFSIITNRRQAGDQLHQLVVSGETSCGKTMIFESPLLDVAHILTTEKGVSRFNCDAKSTLLLHDINLDILVKGGDTGNFAFCFCCKNATGGIHFLTVSFFTFQTNLKPLLAPNPSLPKRLATFKLFRPCFCLSRPTESS